MRHILASLALMATSPFAQAETWHFFNGTLTLELPDGFTADYTPLNGDEIERTDLVRLIRPTSEEQVVDRVSATELPEWQKDMLLSETQAEVITVFEGFVEDAASIAGTDGDTLGPLIRTATAESWHQALSYMFTSYLGSEGVIRHYDPATQYGIVIVPELSLVLHVQQIGNRPLIIAGKNSLEASVVYAKTESLDEAPDFSDYGMSDVEKEFDEACMLTVVRAAFASAEWSAESGM